MIKTLDEKKTAIIEAAIRVFADKGYRASTVADLAKMAGLGEATIYNHFKNKEEILFSIGTQYINHFLISNEEHLRGLKDPEEKLRKYIWQYLWWSSKHKGFIKVFLFEIQPHPHYYHSELYNLIKKVAKVPENILEEGKDAGLFRTTVNPRLFRSFLLGTINYLFFTVILFDRPFEVIDDFDDVAGAMVAAVKRDRTTSSSNSGAMEGKRERILSAAEELFCQKMFFETTISEIAKTANVADGTIYEYFENKDDLLFSLFEKRMKEFSSQLDESLNPKSPATKLRHVLWHFLSYAQTNRAWTKIFFKDLLPNPRFYSSDKYKSMRVHDSKLLGILKQGQEEGIFRGDLKLHLCTAMIYGSMDHICSPWAMLQREHALLNELDDLYDLIFTAIKTNTVK
jgi:TetR/AcrR family fatty acid metabolism transcriptional regulator